MAEGPMTRKTLFPTIRPHRTGHLARDNGHAIYWEQSGNADGTPVIFLHGGPGAGTSAVHRRFFDPTVYRIVLMDQRGCGKSTPFGETAANTTQHLIGDIEAVRTHLGIERWMVFGGSWGSTLAIAYAEQFPERVRALVLRGIFLGRKREIDWFLYGMRKVFPEAWRHFAHYLPEAERNDLLTHYHRRLIDPDPAVHIRPARRWSGYETACSTLMTKSRSAPSDNAPRPGDELSPGDRWALGLARMESHYFVNDLFLEKDALLGRIEAVRAIPAIIVQGRYDIVCLFENADELVQAWPEAQLEVIPDAGHSALEPGITAGLVAATEKFKAL
jgi:proline iminopeptidase